MSVTTQVVNKHLWQFMSLIYILLVLTSLISLTFQHTYTHTKFHLCHEVAEISYIMVGWLFKSR